MNNRLDLWRFLGDLGSNTLRRFDAIRYIRSRDFPPAALYVLHRIATHLPEPHHQACLSAIRSSLRFRGLIPPGPSRPMLAPFLAHPSFRSLLLTQLRGFIRSTTRSALPFHMAQPRIVFKAHRRLSSALFSHLQAAKTWSLGETTCTCTDLAQRHPSLRSMTDTFFSPVQTPMSCSTPTLPTCYPDRCATPSFLHEGS